MKKYGGVVAALVGGFLFGATTILAKLTYSLGLNPAMLTCLRAALALPVLFAILKVQRVSLKLTRREARDILLVGFLGFAPTGALLYIAFSYAPVGLATVLHYMYPVVVTLGGALLFKEKVNPPTAAALVLATVGMLLFFDDAAGAGFFGLLLALISAFTYAVYMLGVARTSLKNLPPFKISFYFSGCSAVLAGVFAAATGNFTLSFQPLGWVYTVLIALLVSVGAFTLVQVAIKLSGPSTAAILSTVEPITSVALGVAVLGETLGIAKGIGGALIIASVLVITIAGSRQGAAKKEAGAASDADIAC